MYIVIVCILCTVIDCIQCVLCINVYMVIGVVSDGCVQNVYMYYIVCIVVLCILFSISLCVAGTYVVMSLLRHC